VWLAVVGLSGSHVGHAQSGTPSSRLIDSLARPDTNSEYVWQALRSRALPLVERIRGDSGHAVVTFVWHGDSTTRNVVVVSPLTLVDFAGSIMTRLGRTDIWYRSFVLPTDVRFVYRFAPNDNLVPFERDTNLFSRLGTMQRDPLNPRTFDYGAFGTMSIVELPDAPSDTLIRRRPSVRAGVVARFLLPSHVLKQDRVIWVYTPPAYAGSTGARPPVVVLSDGESYQSLIPTPVILDNLIADSAIPPVVVVFVDNPIAAREHDLNCNPEWGAFLATQVMPWLDAHYRITRDPRRRVVGGYSLGGLAAACVAIQYPTTFGNVIAQSGSFFRAPSGEEPEWVARHLARGPRLPVKFALSIGRYETAAIPNRDPSMLTASRHVRDVLVAKGYVVHYRELSSGHEHVAWRAVLGDMLRSVLGPQTQ
jgi:enterochelin esterase-like enzyme